MDVFPVESVWIALIKMCGTPTPKYNFVRGDIFIELKVGDRVTFEKLPLLADLEERSSYGYVDHVGDHGWFPTCNVKKIGLALAQIVWIDVVD